MNLFINECSFKGQFASFDDFMQNEIFNMLEIFDFCVHQHFPILIHYKFIELSVVRGLQFRDLLKKHADDTEIQRLKIHIQQSITEYDYTENEDDIECSYILEKNNCFTEVLLQGNNSVLFSLPECFEFESRFLTVIKNHKKEYIKNCTNIIMLIGHGIDLGEVSNSFPIHKGKYKVEVRFNESSHHIPHFHVSLNNRHSISLSIYDCTKIVGDATGIDMRYIRDWFECNKCLLKALWKYTQNRVLV